jgi:choline-sulfatase
MQTNNVLLILSDEHTRNALGCFGNPKVLTPNLDRLAARGTRFDKAYTPSPVCVPARASIATGRHVYETGFWSNAQPYDGSIRSWGHRLVATGHRVVSVGKLHYRSEEDFNGFDEEIIPLHVRGGIGWVHGLLGRRDGATWPGTSHFAEEIGPGNCDYNRYDTRVRDECCRWLRNEAPAASAKPWVMCASFVTPHYPLIVPARYYELYDPASLEPPRLRQPHELSPHPVVAGIRRFFNYDDHFDARTRMVAKASYYGLCSFLDDHIGHVLQALDDSGQASNTIVIYTSDHGEMAGNHGMWTKCNMYEESVAIPMILAGPGVPAGGTTDQPASLIDLYPTIMDITGIGADELDATLPGVSLRSLALSKGGERPVLSEYHDGGSITGMFMLRHGDWKYVYYPGYPPQLFNELEDPFEAQDLGTDPGYGPIRAELEAVLRALVDPDHASERAFEAQERRIAEFGGREGVLAMEDYDQSPVPV